MKYIISINTKNIINFTFHLGNPKINSIDRQQNNPIEFRFYFLRYGTLKKETYDGNSIKILENTLYYNNNESRSLENQ